MDQHNTATDGKYELGARLEEEFKIGSFNSDYLNYFEPLFPNLESLNFQFCNSKNTVLIRAADIVANRIYCLAKNHLSKSLLVETKNIFIHRLP